ncbi:CAP domain-containing protein [Chloroflexota bacterium]
MVKIMRITTLSILSIIILLSTLKCASSPSISQEEYDSVKSELSDVKNQVATLQNKLNEAMIIEVQYNDLNTQYEELEKQHDARIDEIQTIKSGLDELNAKYEQLNEQADSQIDEIQAIQAEYDDLNKEFEELKRQYAIIVQGTVVFSEDEIDQAIFELINGERINNGISELEWGVNLYKWAKENSREMAEKGEYKYSEWSSWQEVFRAARYGTIDQIANAALIIWKNNDYRYRYNVINIQSKYGAVATYKLGEVYYISYMASTFK